MTEQLSIESMIDLPPGDAGRHELALQAAAGSARLEDLRYAAGLSVATALARALDVAERRGDTSTATQSAKSYLDVLGRLGLLPDPDEAAATPATAGGVSDAGPVDPLGRFGGAEVVHLPGA